MKNYTLLFALLAVGILGLGACASDKDKDSADKDADKTEKVEEPKIKTEDLICPQVAILQEAQEITDYGGEKADPTQLVAKARMVSVKGDCAYRKDGIDIAFTLHMASLRGPKLGKQVSFPFFIAIVDPAENIVSRQTVTAQFKFSSDDKIVFDDEALHVFIPLNKKALQSGPDYRVIAGYQLSKSQMQP